MNEIRTPYYIIYEDKLRDNLNLIKSVSDATGVEIIMAFKANAVWRTFPIFREYGISSTASSINEMLLGNDELKKKVHSYCPVYTDETIDKFIEGSTHITFNSLSQFNKYENRIKKHNIDNPQDKVSMGLRINPEYTVIDTDIYNPCAPGSRFGVTISEMPDILPENIEGLHFHALCESTSYDLEKVLSVIENNFGKYLDHIKWINMGGGHLMTRKDYDVDHLINLLINFRKKHPNLHVILEPGSAFTWQTGDLVSSVLDVVNNANIKTAIVDVSFACHMPDCLEMPYKPKITSSLSDVNTDYPTYRMGGNSCLSGDFVGDWSFEKGLNVGDKVIFEDMNHYTTVKTNMFNGISHPAIYIKHLNGNVELLRDYTYLDYKNRMS